MRDFVTRFTRVCWTRVRGYAGSRGRPPGPRGPVIDLFSSGRQQALVAGEQPGDRPDPRDEDDEDEPRDLREVLDPLVLRLGSPRRRRWSARTGHQQQHPHRNDPSPASSNSHSVSRNAATSARRYGFLGLDGVVSSTRSRCGSAVVGDHPTQRRPGVPQRGGGGSATASRPPRRPHPRLRTGSRDDRVEHPWYEPTIASSTGPPHATLMAAGVDQVVGAAANLQTGVVVERSDLVGSEPAHAVGSAVSVGGQPRLTEVSRVNGRPRRGPRGGRCRCAPG